MSNRAYVTKNICHFPVPTILSLSTSNFDLGGGFTLCFSFMSNNFLFTGCGCDCG
uniref:Uncharacterized protein n=1 Tax=Rhizophora mucronata TaxID=61149 RepID=A0A2P2JWE1_RHIMU